jgi:hypothetical protein
MYCQQDTHLNLQFIHLKKHTYIFIWLLLELYCLKINKSFIIIDRFFVFFFDCVYI